MARAATAGATCSVALVRPGGHLRGRPVVGLLDETPAGRRVLGLAARLAMSDAGNLLLVLPHLPPDRLHAIRAAAADALASLGMSATFHALGANTADELLATFQAVEGRLLLVPAEPPLRPGEIRRIVDGAPCPLVVVR